MALLEDDDDLLAGTVLQETKNIGDSALKQLNAWKNKQQQREAKAEERKRRVQQQAAALETEEVDDSLAKQQRDMEEMGSRVMQELDQGDSEAGGPEPDAYLQAIYPVQALPDLQLQDLPELQAALQSQAVLLGLPHDTSTLTGSSSTDPQQQLSDTFAWLLAEGGPLEACPNEGLARATFAAVCYGDSGLALAAYNRFMAWCGEPEVVAGSDMLNLNQLLQWSAGASKQPQSPTLDETMAPGTVFADCMPTITIPWLPSAADVLQALAALGFKQQQQQQQRGSQQQQQASQQHQEPQQQQQHHQQQQQGNLPLLLKLVGRVARGVAAGRLDGSGLVFNQQQYLALLQALLTLMLDQRVTLACRHCLPEAFAAVIELPDDSMWDRLVRDTAPGSLLGALSGGLGPSHRSSVALLSQMPRSQRGTVLRQLGALQLMARLIPKAKAQVPPARISSMDPQQLRHSLHKEVQTLLGPEGRVRVLLIGLSQPAEPSGRLQVWLLSSVLEAADLVLWVDVSTPGVGIRPDLHGWLLDWLNALDRVLDKKLSNHLVRSKVAAMENAYEFAAGGRVVFSGADTPWEA